MNFENILKFFLSLSGWTIIKIFFLIALLIYVCFAFILGKQVSLMTQTIYGQLDFLLKTVSSLLLLLAITVFVAALLFL